MASYVLVHGAWGGGENWLPMARQLRAKGHDVHVAALTGLGARTHQLSPSITLSTHIADVAGLIDTNDLDDIILVGHSYGGMVISGIAAKWADHIRGLVFVDAFLPRDGESLWDIADDPSRKHYIDAQRTTPGLVAPFPGNTRPDARHPLLTLIEPYRATGREIAIKRRTYVYATRGAPTVFSKFHERVATDKTWEVHRVDAGHMVMHDQPAALLDILLKQAV
jgi:pimeloyl-ACP methyl ester carboxylesterase